jgi:hypothetical protein
MRRGARLAPRIPRKEKPQPELLWLGISVAVQPLRDDEKGYMGTITPILVGGVVIDRPVARVAHL